MVLKSARCTVDILNQKTKNKTQDGGKTCLMQLYPEVQDIETIDKNFNIAGFCPLYKGYNCKNER